MNRIAVALLAAGLLSGCMGTNPFEPDTTDGTGGSTGGTTGGDTGTPIVSDRELPPGTASPTPSSSIFRSEPVDANGGGSATGIRYVNDAGQDQFYVDGIAFDGDNTYTRGTAVSSIGPVGAQFQVYEAKPFSIDPLTGSVSGTFDYRAIYGRSVSGQTEFAIVRTASYNDYGFGGFVYQRNALDKDGNPVALVLPTCAGACTATYNGTYAGTRVFRGGYGLEYTSGTAQVVVDFEDFNDGQSGVAVFVRNRRLYDMNGNDITTDYVAALEALDANTTLTNVGSGSNVHLPDIRPIISPDDADSNGEVLGDVFTRLENSDGTQASLASGKYYAIMSGANAEEIVGVLVIESNDPRVPGVSVQETGGFIVYRQ